MQEEAVNTAIIQETEEELQQINKSLYKASSRNQGQASDSAVYSSSRSFAGRDGKKEISSIGLLWIFSKFGDTCMCVVGGGTT